MINRSFREFRDELAIVSPIEVVISKNDSRDDILIKCWDGVSVGEIQQHRLDQIKLRDKVHRETKAQGKEIPVPREDRNQWPIDALDRLLELRR